MIKSLFTIAFFLQNLYVETFRKVSNSRPNHCFFLFAANISLTLYFHKNFILLPSSVRRLIIALACEESSEDLSFKNGLLQIDKDVKRKNPSSINIKELIADLLSEQSLTFITIERVL